MEAIRAYIYSIKNIPLLDEKEERRLFRLSKKGDEAIKILLINSQNTIPATTFR
jgi:hypothetical protein